MSLFRRSSAKCPACGHAARRDVGERSAGGRVRKVELRCPACKATFEAPLDGAWWVLLRDPQGRLTREKVGPDKEAARRVEAAKRTAIVEGRWEEKTSRCTTTLAEAVAAYLAHIKPMRKPSNYYAYATTLVALQRDLGAGRRLDTLTEAALESYRHDKTAAGLMPGTINKHLAILGSVLTFAVKRRMIRTRPKIATPNPQNERTRFLTRAEVGRLVAACPPHVADLVTAAVSTGCRLGELLAMRWDWIDQERGILSLPASACKSGRARHIPINGTFAALLAGRKAKSLPGPLVFDLAGRQVKTFWRAFQGAAETAKLADLRFHDLRHTFASWLVQGGTDLYSVATLLGHASLAMSARYSHLAPDHLRGAVAQAELGPALSPPPPTTESPAADQAPEAAQDPSPVPSLIPRKVIPFKNTKAMAC